MLLILIVFQISISYSHTIGTRVRLSLMRSISKRQREHDPKAVCSVSSFTARPMLRVGGGKDSGTRFLTFVDAMLGFKHLLTQEDIDKAASMCQNLKGHLRSRFLVISDDRAPPPPPQSKKRQFSDVADDGASIHHSKRVQNPPRPNSRATPAPTSQADSFGPSIFSPSGFPPLGQVSFSGPPPSGLHPQAAGFNQVISAVVHHPGSFIPVTSVSGSQGLPTQAMVLQPGSEVQSSVAPVSQGQVVYSNTHAAGSTQSRVSTLAETVAQVSSDGYKTVTGRRQSQRMAAIEGNSVKSVRGVKPIKGSAPKVQNTPTAAQAGLTEEIDPEFSRSDSSTSTFMDANDIEVEEI